jgi:hypothetical protein
VKAAWRAGHHRGRRPAVWTPGDTLVIDWGSPGRLHVFCAVLAWSRFRFVRFAAGEKAATTLALLAGCFEVLGGVPKTVLAERMGCLKAGVVANVVVPAPDYVRLATHYGFRPDFCEAADPESKGIVEHLVGYDKRDLIVPADPDVADLSAANAEATRWCAEVNAAVHSEICAVPASRLDTERELLGELPSLRPEIGPRPASRKAGKLSCVRFGSAEHQLVAPGEVSITDEHYGSARPDRPRRAPRPRTAPEKQFLALGDTAAAFLTGAAAAGASSLGREISQMLTLQARTATPRSSRRWNGPRSSAAGAPMTCGRSWPPPEQRPPRPAGQALVLTLPQVPVRPLSDYALGGEQ